MQFIVNEPNLKYYDNRNTPQRETLKDIVLSSLAKTTDSLNRRAAKEPLAWYKAKNTSVTHLARLAPFSYSGLATGGWGNTVNAMKNNHGPSWRMVVKMSETPEAWGVYPGGQSGNPGSIHYADYLKHWADGKYYKLLFLHNSREQHEARIKYTWTIQPDN
jgi:penicillin amidase